jgi:CysZ protein
MPDPFKTAAMPSKSALKSKNFLSEFVAGAIMPFQAFKLTLENPKLRRITFLPVLTSFLLYAALLIYLFIHLGGWVATLAAFWGAHLPAFLSAIIVFSVGAGLLYFSIQYVSVFITLICSPFNDEIAAQTEKIIGAPSESREGFSHHLKVFFVDLRKSIFIVGCMAVCFLGLLVPGMNLIFLVGLSLVNTLNFITYAQSRRVQGVRSALGWIRRNFALSLGFGIVMGAGLSIPILNCWLEPLGVVGGTLLYLRTVTELENLN